MNPFEEDEPEVLVVVSSAKTTIGPYSARLEVVRAPDGFTWGDCGVTNTRTGGFAGLGVAYRYGILHRGALIEHVEAEFICAVYEWALAHGYGAKGDPHYGPFAPTIPPHLQHLLTSNT